MLLYIREGTGPRSGVPTGTAPVSALVRRHNHRIVACYSWTHSLAIGQGSKSGRCSNGAGSSTPRTSPTSVAQSSAGSSEPADSVCSCTTSTQQYLQLAHGSTKGWREERGRQAAASRLTRSAKEETRPARRVKRGSGIERRTEGAQYSHGSSMHPSVV